MTRADPAPTTQAPAPRRYDAALEELSVADLRAFQWSRLRSLLEHVSRANAFYRERFERAGVSVDDIRTVEDLLRIPVIRKEDVVADIAAAPPFGRRLQVPREQIDKVIESSGSTGKGREVQALTAADTEAFFDLSAFGMKWMGVERGRIVMSTVPITTTGAGQTYHGALRRLAANVFEIGMYDARRKVDCLRRYGASVVIATPSYLRRLEHVAAEEGVDVGALGAEALAVAAEAYSVEFGRGREEAWGARLFEQYGSTQRVAAWTCERGALPEGGRGMLHAISHLALCEVVDPQTGEHVAPGERGELVITTLQGEAAPLIRYATGDEVRYLPAGSCPCGRPFEGFEAGTVHRLDAMMKIRGVNVWPETIDGIVFGRDEVRDYRAELSLDDVGREVVRLTVEPVAGCDRPPVAELRDELRRVIGVGFDVVACPPGGLPEPGDSFAKNQRWTDTRGR